MKCDQNQENPVVSLLLCLLTLKTAVLRHLKILYSRHFIYFFFFVLLNKFIIDNAKPTCLFFKLNDLLQIARSIIC